MPLNLPKGFLYQFAVTNWRIIDGDTVEVTVLFGFDIFTTQSCRILHVDAPEHTTSAGLAVKAVTEKWLTAASPLFVVSVQWDKYAGRFDGIIWNSDKTESLTDYLLAQGLVRPYEGDKKKPWGKKELAAIEAKANAILAPAA
jgi:endonuclease YncB( thermonuclease family)